MFCLLGLLQSIRSQSISSQEQVQHQNAKNTQHRDQQLSYFSKVSSNVTNDYPASVLTGDVCVVSSLAACVAPQLGGCFLAPHTVWLACVGRLTFLVRVCL